MNWIEEEPAGQMVVRHQAERLIWQGRSDYQQIVLAENSSRGKFLLLDGDLQSATADEFIYHEMLVHPALLSHSNPFSVLILGGGEGATAREVLRHSAVRRVVNVELDARVVEVCRRWAPEYSQGAFEDPRLQLVLGDAFAYLRESSERFDVVISDLTEPHPGSPSQALLDDDYFRLLRGRLAPGGLLATQASSGSPDRLEGLRHIEAGCSRTFSRQRIGISFIPSFGTTWCFLTAGEEIAEIDSRRLAAISGLRYLDEVSLRRDFSLPRYVREELEKIATP